MQSALVADCESRPSHRGRTAFGHASVISVIDDDASARAATDSLLRARGYIVHAFASAAEFLRSPQFEETSCVITDVRMPEMNGLELQALLRDQGCSVPIIFVTAFAEESVRARALHDGAVCFLSKPFDAAALIGCIRRALAAADALER